MLSSTPAYDMIPPPSCPAWAMSTTVNVGSRKSALAMIQANHTSNLLSDAHPEFSFPIHTVQVLGDADKVTPFAKLAGTTADVAKSLWTKEIEDRLLACSLDLIVHSLKDMPTVLPKGCSLGAFIEREDPRDALVVKPGLPYTTLADLPDGSVVGTSSVRRKAQLKHSYPGLLIQECRGNVDSRLAKLDAPNSPYTCLILASAGLDRMGLSHRITSRITGSSFLYAVGQGALGIEIRDGDKRTLSLLSAIDHIPTRYRCLAERSLLRKLQGGCSAPVGVLTTFDPLPAKRKPLRTQQGSDEEGDEDDEDVRTERLQGLLTLTASITSPEGEEEVGASHSVVVSGDGECEHLGLLVAEDLLAGGGARILAALDRPH
ncbi:putative porphobilinogen deaminase [Geopyxis carbonaria]|nr:putative porphobilinogen deaminase [Geopyxis carbonaria]